MTSGGFASLAVASADQISVDLTHCPHDGAALQTEFWSGGSLLIFCPACDTRWEWHGAWVREVGTGAADAGDDVELTVIRL